MFYDAVIIGGGAAGLFCAIQAGKRGKSVLVIEHNDAVGRKIEISGGGRCNFTNLHITPENYVSSNPRFCISALNRYTQHDFIALIVQHKIHYHEKKLGQLFCDDRSNRIVNMLLNECKQAKVEIAVNTKVEEIEKHSRFHIKTTAGAYKCDALVIASGGLSLPKIGATGFGYQIAKQFGIKMIERKPGLVPLTWNECDSQNWGDLRGLSFPARVQCSGIYFDESVLFTHKGLSGPAILQISNYWNSNDEITVNLFPHINIHLQWEQNRSRNITLQTFLSQYLPSRMAQRLVEMGLENKPLKQYSQKEINQIITKLQQWQVYPSGTEGYRKAEVTLGGVDTRELNPKTMESKKVPGLYFIGEVVDVTGWLGGYNFQWAWSSGFAAGTSL